MLALRLGRGARPPAQLRRLLLAAVAAGAGFVLLGALAYALAHPDRPGRALPALAWCALPLAATAQLAVAVAHADPVHRPRSALDAAGLDAAGLRPAGVRTCVAVSTAVAAVLGALWALLLFLHLRGELSGLPFDGRGGRLLAAGRPLPPAATLTLLALVPLSATAAAALVPRPPAGPAGPPPGAGRGTGTGGGASGPSASLPWGAALACAGIALAAYAAGQGPPPGAADAISGGLAAGWLLTAAGLVVAGPGLVDAAGRALAAGQPGAARLLAGRALQLQAPRIGRPLGTVAAVVAGLLAAVRLGGPGAYGPLGTLGAVVVLVAVSATAAIALGTARAERAGATAVLTGLGAGPRLARRTARQRAVVLLLVFAPLSWLTARLLVLPLG